MFINFLLSVVMLSSMPQAQAANPSTPQASEPFTTTPASVDPQAKPEENAAPAPNLTPDEMAHRYIEYWNTADPKVLKSFFTPFSMVSRSNRIIVSERMLTRVVASWRASMPDLNFKIEDTLAQGDKIAVRLSLTGTYKARLFPNTADPSLFNPPRHIRATEMLIFHLKDGKLWEVWEEFNELFMREQMGGRWVPTEQLDSALRSPSSSKPSPKHAQPAKPQP